MKTWDSFYYWLDRARAINVGDEQTARAYRYLMSRAFCVLKGEEWNGTLAG